jgi:hypothetical protein
MKVTNVSTKKIYLKDLRVTHESLTEGRRGEDVYIAAGASKYLPDTSDVMRSAQKGDIKKWKDAGVVTTDDQVVLAATGNPGDSVVLTHSLGYLPDVRVYKQVGATWVDATGVVDIVHNNAFTTTTISNPTAFALTVLIKLS